MSAARVLVLSLATACAPPDVRAPAPAGAGPPEDPALATVDAFLAQAAADGSLDRTRPGWRLAIPAPPDLEFPADSTYIWRLDTTKGPLVVRLLPAVAPRHVASTIHLTRAGFYDGLGFHRVVGGFMAQGGCPLGTGTGDPGYLLAGELDDGVLHDRPGLVSAANAEPDADGSQFFVTFAPAPTLDGLYTIFGEVLGGEETLHALEQTAQTREQMERTYSEAPLDPITIRAATITSERP